MNNTSTGRKHFHGSQHIIYGDSIGNNFWFWFVHRKMERSFTDFVLKNSQFSRSKNQNIFLRMGNFLVCIEPTINHADCQICEKHKHYQQRIINTEFPRTKQFHIFYTTSNPPILLRISSIHRSTQLFLALPPHFAFSERSDVWKKNRKYFRRFPGNDGTNTCNLLCLQFLLWVHSNNKIYLAECE